MIKPEIYFQRYSKILSIAQSFIPAPETEIIVVIPSFKEPHLKQTLQSLGNCSGNQKVLVLVVVNEPENASENVSKENKNTIKLLNAFKSNRYELVYEHQVLPKKKAGVGLARKLGMDTALFWYNQLEKTGIICCLDADCSVAPNYLMEIETYYQSDQKSGIVFYEHPLENPKIVAYELHLRHYVDALRCIGFPYAMQTLGSCITVLSDVYMKVGGMNSKRAGEDFYFIQKLVAQGGFGEINNTTVYPSPRFSDRVPFGTGAAIFRATHEEQKVYHQSSYTSMGILLSILPEIYEGDFTRVPEELTYSLDEINFKSSVEKLRINSPNFQVFMRQFYTWFDGFKMLKYLHLRRDKGLEMQSIEEGYKWLNENYYKLSIDPSDRINWLKNIRDQNRKNIPSYKLSTVDRKDF